MKDPNEVEIVKSNGSREMRVRVLGVSRGVGVGKLVLLYGSNRQFFKTEIDDSRVDIEVRRFREAIAIAGRQLERIAYTSGDSTAGGIISAQRAMLDDPEFSADIEKIIRKDLVNAEWAVKSVTDRFVAQYKTLSDEYIRERYLDIEDVAERILTTLGGDRRLKPPEVAAG